MSSNDIVVIHQPDFLPYLGFFHRLRFARTYIVLDDVQFTRGGTNCWQNRDKIKTTSGEKWITVGVQKTHLNTKINEVLLSNQEDWRPQHLGLIKNEYRKTPYFKEIFPYIEELYNFQCDKLVDFNWKSITMLMSLLDVECEILWASELEGVGKSNELVADLVCKANSNTYLSGVGARSYFDPTIYEQKGIKVLWQNFQHPVYPQLHGDFIPYLSSIDILLNCGIEKSRIILKALTM